MESEIKLLRMDSDSVNDEFQLECKVEGKISFTAILDIKTQITNVIASDALVLIVRTLHSTV